MPKDVRQCELEAEYAEAMIAYKNAETTLNFYKKLLMDYFKENNYNLASRKMDGCTVVAEFVEESVSRSFNQSLAKQRLSELLGNSYVEEDFYKTGVKAPYVKVSVNYDTDI